MKNFDVNAPFEVEITFEESVGDDVSFQNALSEQETIKDKNNNKQITHEKCETIKNGTSSGNQINHEDFNKTMLSLKPIDELIEDMVAQNNVNIGKNAEIIQIDDLGNRNEKKSNDTQHAIIDNTINNEESVPVGQINDHHQPANTFVEDLLNKLSEHIVFIIEKFYQYAVKRGNTDIKTNEKLFHVIKCYYFELSYTIVESIILPQEQNESFMNKFLDNTVLIANRKFKTWKCRRGHVLTFLKELITFAKNKRECIKTNIRPCPSNQNIFLKQQLLKPLAPLNIPVSEILTNNNTEPLPVQNNLSIFSSGISGNEIRLDIDANTYLQITEKQQTVEQNVNHNNHEPSCGPAKRKSPVAKPRYENRIKDIQKKNPQYDRPPPPYDVHQSFRNVTNRLRQCRHRQYNQTNINQYNQINVNQNQTYYDNMGQSHQYHQNVRQPIHSYPTQVHYVNTNHTSPVLNDDVNYSNPCYNNNIPMVRI